MITETSVRCLLSLAETLNFTKTAKQLFTTQQAVSQQISRLEDDLGVRLFYRDNRRVALTEQGEAVYRFFWETAQRFRELQHSLHQGQYEQPRSLNVGYLRWLEIGDPDVRTANSLQQEYGDSLRLTTFRYHCAELNQKFESGELDVAVTTDLWMPAGRNNLMVLPLRERPIYLYVSPLHPLVTPEATYRDFLSERFYVDQYPGESLSDTIRRCKNDWEPDPNRLVSVAPNRETAITEVELGKGVLMGNDSMQLSTLVGYPTSTRQSTVLLYRKDTENPLVSRFAHLLQKAYQQRENE